ncbi:MAG: hypothetical protein HKO65_11565 [Gemmatimonadetes bacterium]|nr:hypothetical protein [Gemmatimonadota bacterium]NNM05715.1 hypothetical protein [Gemmatimonadota bacterium]
MARPDPILTLEPLLEAVREGLQADGWALSGLQKTTSYEFEGRWAGDSSRSAYLFFHAEGLPEWVSIDVFLDETSRGLKGNLALVIDGPELSIVPDPEEVLVRLATVARMALPRGYRTPLTLRYRFPKLSGDPAESDTEFRFKLYIPPTALKAGHSAIVALAESTAGAFRSILGSRELAPLLAAEET